jgi:hypothetical protein
MRYVAAAALHTKALKVLSIIEDAEKRIQGKEKGIDHLKLVPKNWQQELAIWPFGKPSAAEREREVRNLDITKAAHARLCAYYGRILSRLNDLENERKKT